MKKMCHQKWHISPTKCRFSQMSQRNTHQEPLWEEIQLLLLTSNHALLQTKLSTLLGFHDCKKLCQFKMHSSAPKVKCSGVTQIIQLMWKTAQLQCLTSIHAHTLTKSSVIWELQLIKKKSFKTAYFPTKCHFSQMSWHNANNKLICFGMLKFGLNTHMTKKFLVAQGKSLGSQDTRRDQNICQKQERQGFISWSDSW